MIFRIHVVHHLSAELEYLIRGIPGIENSLHGLDQRVATIEDQLVTGVDDIKHELKQIETEIEAKK